MPALKVVSKKVFIDFGIKKAHAILVGRSNRVRRVDSLSGLRHVRCNVYIEAGCPRRLLRAILPSNRVFQIDGMSVKKAREAAGMAKTDANDVVVIRQIAQLRPRMFRRLVDEELPELEDRMSYSYYLKLTSLIVALKNRLRSFEADSGTVPAGIIGLIETLETEKRKAAEFFSKFGQFLPKLGIRGLGPRYLGGILVAAPPPRFRSLSAYLSYCGLKGSSVISGRYNRHVRGLYHQIASSVVMHKDPTFYRLYLRVKMDLGNRFPEYRKSRIEGMARNRLATFLAKEAYRHFKNSRGPPAIRVASAESGNRRLRKVPQNAPDRS